MQLGCSDCETVAIAVPGPPGPPGAGSGGAFLTITGTAAVVLGGHRAVYRRPDGLIDYASASNTAHFDVPIWITTGAAAAGAAVTMIAVGELTEGSWTWTPGLIFLGVNGALTQTVPAEPGSEFLAVLGSALTPTTMYVSRQPSIDLI